MRHWSLAAWSMELRKLFGYRADFWIDFSAAVIVQVSLAWFLWTAVLRARGTDTVGGMGIEALVLYYLMVPLVEKITRGHEMGFLSNEIYEGTLTRYLVLPVSLFGFKYAQHLAVSAIALVQLGVVLTAFVLWRGVPDPFAVDAAGVIGGALAALAASVLYFHLAACLEMVSYWADNVWSLLVMLRFAIRLLGGGMIPLALFPDGLQSVLGYLPFASLLSFPARTLLGEVDAAEYLRSMIVLVAWALVFGGLARWIHARGSRQYTGVGI